MRRWCQPVIVRQTCLREAPQHACRPAYSCESQLCHGVHMLCITAAQSLHSWSSSTVHLPLILVSSHVHMATMVAPQLQLEFEGLTCNCASHLTATCTETAWKDTKVTAVLMWWVVVQSARHHTQHIYLVYSHPLATHDTSEHTQADACDLCEEPLRHCHSTHAGSKLFRNV